MTVPKDEARISSPLADELRDRWTAEAYSFHMPGHKGGHGIHTLARQLLGHVAFRADVSETGGFDYLHAPAGKLRKSQELAARIFGADFTYFLINGSTVGNIVALLATAGDRDKVLLSRASHRSVFTGLVMSGAVPIYIEPVYNPTLDGYFGMDATLAEDLMSAEPNIKAIHVTRPNYYGLCFDLRPFVEAARGRGVPLIVDEAHGAHFAFHPSLPPAAMVEGADLAIQSSHKTLGSLTQSSLLHLRGKLVDRCRLEQALQMTQSSSPSALLLLSLDIACMQMASEGHLLMDRVVQLAESARNRINAIDGLYCYGREIVGTFGIADYDPTKLVVDLSNLGITGLQAAQWLRENRKVGIELSDSRRIVCSVTLGDSEESIEYLTDALHALARAQTDAPRRVPHNSYSTRLPDLPYVAMTPRQAFLSAARVVPFHEAIGEVSAEFIAPYPPCIPILIPGEIFSLELSEYLVGLARTGCKLVGLADPSMSTFRIVG